MSLLAIIKNDSTGFWGEGMAGTCKRSRLTSGLNQDLYESYIGSDVPTLDDIGWMSADELPGLKGKIYQVLGRMLADDRSATEILDLLTAYYDCLAVRAVDLAVESLARQGMGLPPVDFAWYLMGSGGRGEQFMMTDQDHFLVYDNLQSSLDLAQDSASFDSKFEDIEEAEAYLVEEYFTFLGKKIVEILEGIGYRPCPGLMMSSEYLWRGSLDRWQDRFRRWALKRTDEDILNGHNFLSFRYLAGSGELDDKFTSLVGDILEKSSTFLYLMAQQERDFLVPDLGRESRGIFGKRKGTMDIKLHALFPLHRCIQILGVHNGIYLGRPLDILDQLVEMEKIDGNLGADIAWAYERALKIRIRMSWDQYQAGGEIGSKIQLATVSDETYSQLVKVSEIVRRLQNFLIKKL